MSELLDDVSNAYAFRVQLPDFLFNLRLEFVLMEELSGESVVFFFDSESLRIIGVRDVLKCIRLEAASRLSNFVVPFDIIEALLLKFLVPLGLQFLKLFSF